MEQPFDIAPFALPNCAPGEVRFEEARDIVSLVVSFKGIVPRKLSVSYLQSHWPNRRVEELRDLDNPCASGWSGMDDWFNVSWRRAAVVRRTTGGSTVVLTFRPLSAELRKMRDYDVTFRRTLGIRIDVSRLEDIRKIAVHTRSRPEQTRLRVRLNAGRTTPGRSIVVDGYNAAVVRSVALRGLRRDGRVFKRSTARAQELGLSVNHMRPEHRHCGDDGHVRFILGSDSFTISLTSLQTLGPIWFADRGVFITEASDTTTLAEYRERWRGARTVSQRVKQLPDQSYGAAFLGQPRPHAVAYSLGLKHCRQRFWLEPNGDVCLSRHAVWIPGPDKSRYANRGEGRFFFGLEDWAVLGRNPDPAPAVAYSIRLRKEGLELEQKSVATPLSGPLTDSSMTGDRTAVCLMRFRFSNTGRTTVEARLPIGYSQDSRRTRMFYPMQRNRNRNGGTDDWLVPESKRERLTVLGRRIYGRFRGRPALRCAVEGDMRVRSQGDSAVLTSRLQPGQSCDVLLKIPFINLDSRKELRELGSLSFTSSLRRMARYWAKENDKGAQICTPVTQLNDLHKAHLSYVQLSDTSMPTDPYLVNTSVGTSTYGNFSNESCMICQELDQRGLFEEARRRLAVWVKYQGTAKQPGNFTDYDGMYFGAAGYECGQYNQHHGWVLWCMAEHYLVTGDRRWFAEVSESVVAGCDWITRQRANTMGALPHSRGWEKGFLPAGSLEDVTDFYYWLSTNALTWRGIDTAARALEEARHPEAQRVRRDADEYRRCLLRGFETMRQHSPLIRLRDGRWIPHYPSRLYCRGRDFGWIREVLEGSVYLLISGLYDAKSRQAQRILDDFQDTRLMNPPYGYPIMNFEDEWYDRGGVSIQPNLLAVLMPYLDRDEPEMYVWTFLNCWVSCYREEINAMIEHPWPFLGYSNTAHPKTSDEANAVMWLRYMLVYTAGDVLHFGRAMPRAWLAQPDAVELRGVANRFGTFSVSYRAEPGGRCLRADLKLRLKQKPGRTVVRFRHPQDKPIKSVSVNGKRHTSLNPRRGDVDITGMSGRVRVTARYR